MGPYGGGGTGSGIWSSNQGPRHSREERETHPRAVDGTSIQQNPPNGTYLMRRVGHARTDPAILPPGQALSVIPS